MQSAQQSFYYSHAHKESQWLYFHALMQLNHRTTLIYTRGLKMHIIRKLAVYQSTCCMVSDKSNRSAKYSTWGIV